jgi:hypothetical protein
MERDARFRLRTASLAAGVSCLLSLSASLTFAVPPRSDASPPTKPASDVAELIGSKRAQIAKLEEEIAALQAQLPSEPVEIQLKQYEVDAKRLRRLDVDFAAVANGAPYTNEKSTVSLTGASGELFKALEQNNIARLFSNDTLTLTCGQPFTLKKGAEFSLPMSPDGKETRKMSEQEILVTATPQAKGAFRLTLVSKRAQQSRDKTFRIGDQVVPAIRVNSAISSVVALPGQEVVVEGLPDAVRTEAIRTESGIREKRVEIATYYAITIKDPSAGPTSAAAVQPASPAIISK